MGESSKQAGSGKIGRKGIGFKSVFQITDCPLVVSPPFSFCFDTAARGIFGYIVPSFVEQPERHVPPRHHALLRRVRRRDEDGAHADDDDDPSGGGGGGGGGTLLVCPLAARVRGAELLRDFGFDGLSLAFLKNLQKITLVSSSTAATPSADEGASGGAAGSRTAAAAAAPPPTTTHEYRVERELVFEHGADDAAVGGFGGAMLKGVSVISHQLSHCTIVERVQHVGGAPAETRRLYRLHKYTIRQFRASGAAAAAASSSAAPLGATTTISLAFPVGDDLAPQRSASGELVFAYLPVTSAGFGFALHADFELVVRRTRGSHPCASSARASRPRANVLEPHGRRRRAGRT